MENTLWPWLVLVIVGVLPSEIWRVLAVVLSRRLDEGSEWLVWVRAVASCLLAGVVARLLFTPTGALAALPVAGRVAAVLFGVATYAGSKSVLIGIAAGEAAILAVGWLWG